MREKMIEVKQTLEMCYKQGLTSDCNGCAYRGHNNVCMDALMEDALAVINQLESNASVQKWIPVTERLPEEFKEVLVYRFTGCEVDSCVSIQKGYWSYDPVCEYKVTHWMPLPEPPKGE